MFLLHRVEIVEIRVLINYDCN